MLPGRTNVIMAIASGVGVAAGALTYLASHSIPQALLAAAGGSANQLRQLISTGPERPAGDHDNNQDDGHESC